MRSPSIQGLRSDEIARRARPFRLAPDRRKRRRLLAAQRGDLIFDAQLLAFKFRDYEVVWVRSVFFFVNEMLEFCMLGPQGFHVLCHGHLDPPISDRNITGMMLIPAADPCKRDSFPQP
jgi:hypothetical protein